MTIYSTKHRALADKAAISLSILCALHCLATPLALSFYPPLIAMGEAPEKPDPTGLINLSKQLLSKPLGNDLRPIAYLGDTVADVLTIQKAREKYPKQRFISLAVAPPHLHIKENIEERKAYEKLLMAEGADKILQSTKEILKYILDW